MNMQIQPEVSLDTKVPVSFFRIKFPTAFLYLSGKICVRKQNFMIREIIWLIFDSTKYDIPSQILCLGRMGKYWFYSFTISTHIIFLHRKKDHLNGKGESQLVGKML